ncbi:MAG: CHAT domain-containing protein [Cyanobacteria bacterium P01_G01_bin.54]
MSHGHAEPDPKFDYSHQHHPQPAQGKEKVHKDTRAHLPAPTLEELQIQANATPDLAQSILAGSKGQQQNEEVTQAQTSTNPDLAQTALARSRGHQSRLDEEIAHIEIAIQQQEASLTTRINATLTPELSQRYISTLELHYDRYIGLLMEAGYEERAFNASERIRTIAHRAQADAHVGLPETLDLAGVQNEILDGETAILNFSFLSDRVYIWVVTQESMTTHEIPTSEVRKIVTRYTNRVAADGHDLSIQRLAQKLAETLNISSIVDSLSHIKKLVIIPDGILHRVPLDGLPIGYTGEMLLDKYEIVHTPSATSVAISRNQVANREIIPKDDTAVIAAVSDFAWDWEAAANGNFQEGLHLSDLPGVATEAQEIAEIHGEDEAYVLENDNVTIQALQALKDNGYEVIHIGSHGTPGKIFLSDGVTNTEMNIQDIRKLDFSTDLLVLSFCESGFGTDSDGDVTVSRTFLESQGISRVISTMWQVNDKVTAQFMKYFYEAFQGDENMSASQALRAAKIRMRNEDEYSSIFYWGAFKLEGDWRPSPPTE